MSACASEHMFVCIHMLECLRVTVHIACGVCPSA